MLRDGKQLFPKRGMERARLVGHTFVSSPGMWSTQPELTLRHAVRVGHLDRDTIIRGTHLPASGTNLFLECPTTRQPSIISVVFM